MLRKLKVFSIPNATLFKMILPSVYYLGVNAF